MEIKKFRIALLGAIVALATACGAPAPSNSGDPRVDAATNNTETAVVPNDAPSPPPDAVSHDDAGSPTPDAASPVDVAVATDVPAPSDVPVATDTATPPPVDAGVPFNQATCDYMRTHNWLINGSTDTPDTIGCRISPTTSMGTVDLPDAIAARMGEGVGTCSGNSCIVGSCRWVDLSPTMLSFRAICGSREFSIITL